MPNAPRRNRVAALREERDRWRDRAVAAEARVARVAEAVDRKWETAVDGLRKVVPVEQLEKALR